MKIQKKEGKARVELQIMEACILDDAFLKSYVHIHRPDLYTISFAKWLTTTCVTFCTEFHKAPGLRTFRDLFRTARKSGVLEEGDVDAVAEFLSGVQETTVNVEYLLRKATDYLALRAYKELRTKLEVSLEKEDPALCEKAIAELRITRSLTGDRVNPLTDKEKVIEAYEAEEAPLLRVPGALGKILTSQLRRKRFVTFLAKAKVGKTWLLYKLAIMCKRSGLNVALFAAGDEDRDNSIIRLGSLLTGKNNDPEECGTFAMPIVDCKHNQDGDCTNPWRIAKCPLGLSDEDREEARTPEELLELAPSKYVPCSRCRKRKPEDFIPAIWYEWSIVEHGDWRETWRAFRRFNKPTRGKSIELFTYPNDTLTVAEMERVLDVVEDQEGWVPDVVIVDYPDIMKEEGGGDDTRHKENRKWKSLRRFNQERNVLLIVVSQSNMGGYQKESLEATNVNEDRRKLDHVTAMYAINQTPKEKRMRTARLAVIVQRKGRFDIGRQVQILQFLEAGQFCRDSFLIWKEVDETWQKKE